MWTSDKLTEEDSGFLAIGNQKINLNVLSKMYFIFLVLPFWEKAFRSFYHPILMAVTSSVTRFGEISPL